MAIFTTHTEAPRVLLANSNIVPKWATQENFDKWERDGLIMYGQMTAGSWIYIGTQGVLPGTSELHGILAAATLITVVGAIDDRFDLHPAVKLAGQAAAAWIAVSSGLSVEHVTIPFAGPLSFGQVRLRLFGSWGLTRGHGLALALLALATLLLAVLVDLAAQTTLVGFVEVATGMLRWRADQAQSLFAAPVQLSALPWLLGAALVGSVVVVVPPVLVPCE